MGRSGQVIDRRARVRFAAFGVAALAVSVIACSVRSPVADPPARAAAQGSPTQGLVQASPAAAASPSTTAPPSLACDSPVLAAPASTAQWAWTAKVFEGEVGAILALATNAVGDIFVAGTERTKTHLALAFVAKYSALGHRLWRVNPAADLPSTFQPPRATASSLSAEGSKVRALIWSGGHGSAIVTLGANGKLEATRELPLTASETVAPGNGGFFLVHHAPDASAWALTKIVEDGSAEWSKALPMPAALATLALTASSFDEGIAIAGSSQQSPSRTPGEIRFHCAGESEECRRPARALFVLSPDPAHERFEWHSFAANTSDFAVASVTRVGSTRSALAGTFAGAATLGSTALCELPMPRTPTEKPTGFSETGQAPRCQCLVGREQLFVAMFDQAGTPVWARSIARGEDRPALTERCGDHTLWGGLVSGDTPRDERLTLIEFDAQGKVVFSHSAPDRRARPLLATGSDGSVYVASGAQLSRLSLAANEECSAAPAAGQIKSK